MQIGKKNPICINPPMRPIVSQIGTPTAEIAAQINDIIVKYMPTNYMVKSTNEFLSIVLELEHS